MRYTTLFLVILGSLIVSFHRSRGVEFTNCGSFFSFGDIHVDGCGDDDKACRLPIGNTTNVTFTMDTGEFDIDADLLNEVAFYVTGIKFNLTVTAPEDPCDVLLCPLQLHYTTTYSSAFYVNDHYVPLSVSIRFLLETADLSEQLLCFEFPAVLVK